MTPRPRAMLPAFVALLAAFSPRAALGVERACAAVAVEPSARFREQFPDLLDRIVTELGARPELDRCARVELGFEDDSVIGVFVTLPDGRAARRTVTRGDDVLPTLEALLLVPDPTPVAPMRPAPAFTEKARPAVPHDSMERTLGDAPTPASAAPRAFGFELSALSGARVGDGQFGYGVGVLSLLELKSWLIGFEGRADGYRAIAGGDPETALELAILAGKRFDFGAVALDLSAGPAVVQQGFALSRTERTSVAGTAAMPPPAPPPEPSSGPVARLLVGARVGFSPRSVFRTFVGIDGEWGPVRSPLAPGDNSSPPSMPSYTLGVSLGATVGTR